MSLEFNSCLLWPNRKGFTPVTNEYAQLVLAMDALKPAHVNLDDLPASQYHLWNVFDDRLASMQLAGHVGASTRF